MKIEVNRSHEVLLSSTKEENPFDIDCRELKSMRIEKENNPAIWTFFVGLTPTVFTLITTLTLKKK